MKKIVLILATVLLVTCSVMFAFSACSSSETDDNSIIMYTHMTFAPYEWVGADGKETGLDVAIMSQVAENLGKKLVIKDVAFDSIFSTVAKGNSYTVGAAGITINETRKKQVDFSSVYSSSTLVIVSKSTISSLKGLENLSVAVQKDTSAHTILKEATSEVGYSYTVEGSDGSQTQKNIKLSSLTIREFSDYNTCRINLQNGNVNAIVMDKLPAESLFFGDGSVNIYPASELPQEDFGIAVKKGNATLLDAINEVVDIWLANGNMDKYLSYYSALYEYENGGGEQPTPPSGLKLEWNC